MTGNKLVSYLKKSFFTGAFKTVIVTLSTIIFLPLIIKQVGMEKYGLISLTMIFGGMVAFADFGIAKTITLLIGKDKSKANLIVSNGFVINIALSALIASIVLILVYFNVPILGGKLQITSQLKNYIFFIGTLYLIILLINNLLIAVLESYYLMHYVNVGFTISSILLNAFIYITSTLTDSIYLLILSPVFSFLSVTLFLLTIIIKHTDVRLTRPSFKEMREMLLISYQFLNLSLINSLIIPANKFLVIYITGSTTALGVFDIGIKISLIANSFLNSIAQPLYGVFSSMRNKYEEIYKIAKNTSLLLFVFYTIGNILFYFVGETITGYIDKNNHTQLFLISMILLAGVSFTSVSESFYRALLGTERLKEAFYLKLLIPILNIALYLLLQIKEELVHIAITYSLSLFISSLFIIFYYVQNNERLIK